MLHCSPIQEAELLEAVSAMQQSWERVRSHPLPLSVEVVNQLTTLNRSIQHTLTQHNTDTQRQSWLLKNWFILSWKSHSHHYTLTRAGVAWIMSEKDDCRGHMASCMYSFMSVFIIPGLANSIACASVQPSLAAICALDVLHMPSHGS